jgi:hypothetical protein
MAQIQVDIPTQVAHNFWGKKIISYHELIEDYEAWFEYEAVNMDAWDFKRLLVSELLHD